MADISELYAAIGDLLVADSLLTTHADYGIGAGANARFYFGQSDSPLVVPQIIASLVNAGPDDDYGQAVEFHPDWQFLVYHTRDAGCQAMIERLAALLEIPRRNTTAVTTTNYVMPMCAQGENLEMGLTGRTTANGQPIVGRVVLFRSIVRRTT